MAPERARCDRQAQVLEAGDEVVETGGRDVEDDELLVRGQACLLYTSDAADERSSVDLGGRRIMKKKKKKKHSTRWI